MQIIKKHCRLIQIIALLFCLTGCNNFLLGDENLAESLDLPQNPKAVVINTEWSKQIGDGNDGKVLHLHPTVIGNTGFIASADGNIVSFDTNTGQTIWRLETGHKLSAGVGSNNHIVVVGNSEGLLMVYNAVNGRLLWTHQLSSEMVSQPMVVKDTIIARAIDGQVTALDARNARVLWKQNIGVANLSIRGNSRGLLLGNAVLFTNSKGATVLLSLENGEFVYSALLIAGSGLSEIQRIPDIIASPTIRDHKAFFSAYRQKTIALNLKQGTIVWETPISTSKDLFADSHNLYLIDKNSIINAIDINTGNLVWQNTDLIGRRISAITGNGKYIITSDNEGYLIVISATNGQLLSYREIADEASSIPAFWVSNDSFLFYSQDGQLSKVYIAP